MRIARTLKFAAGITIALAIALVSGAAAAQMLPAQMPTASSNQPCALGMVDAPDNTPRIWPVATDGSALAAGSLRIQYLGHSSFLIETPGGASAVTDYNGVHRPPYVPDVVTMNNSHTTHYTEFPDTGIRHVLRGWDDSGGGIVHHDVTVKDLRVFSVPTNIVTLGSGPRNDNSIFVFQSQGLCVAHLGHLHHLVGTENARKLGRIDVLFVPIDGSSTMSHTEAADAVREIAPKLVIPMHYHFGGAAESFIALLEGRYEVRVNDSRTVTISRRTLPAATEVLFLAPW